MIKILIADDHAILREGLKRIIENAGLVVVAEATTGHEALEKARETQPDVVLLDVSMPGKGGLETAQELKERHPRLRVLMLTVHPEDHYAVRCLKGGADGYLTKDVAAAQLVEAIRKVYRGGKFISPTLAERLAESLGPGFGSAPHEALSNREFEVLRRIGAGQTVGQIAEQLHLSVRTVRTYRTRILEKMNMKTTAEIMREAEERRARADGDARFRLTVKATNDVIWDWDHGSQRIWLSESVARFGYPAVEREEPLDWLVERLHPGDRERVMASVRAVCASALQSWSSEYRFRRADGGWAYVLDRGFVLRDAEGRAVRMVGAMADMSERRQLEEQLRQAQKMEAVGRLAGGIAHDFNNLLTVILGYGGVVAERVAADPEAMQGLEEMLSAGERAATLTRQLLAFSRKQVLQPQLLDLNAVVHGVEQMLRRLIGEDVELHAALAPDLGAVLADLGQLEQVLLNLAINARDAMPGGGKLTIATANVELDRGDTAERAEVQPGRYVQLTVTDTGTGIDPEVQRHLFEPFFTTKEPGKGTGLGLATCYGIVRQSGGHIWVDSEPGQGASFKIYLPRMEGAVTAATAREAPGAAARGAETILLVEDDANLRRLARTVLEGQGYRLLEAESPAAALELATAHDGAIDLLLTDVVMPGLGGPELARRIRARLPGLRVLLMSGYADDAVLRHGLAEAGTAFLQKPFNAAGLARKVREVLDEPAADAQDRAHLTRGVAALERPRT